MVQTTFMVYDSNKDLVTLRTAPNKKGKVRQFKMSGQFFEDASKKIKRNWTRHVGLTFTGTDWTKVPGSHTINGGSVEVTLRVGESKDPRVMFQEGNYKRTFDLEVWAKNPKNVNVYQDIKAARATKTSLNKQVL